MLNRYILVALFLSVHFAAFAQISEGGLPPALRPENELQFAALKTAPVVLPTFDINKAWEEDSRAPGRNRFAAPIAADLSPAQQGQWLTLPTGEQVWQCQIKADKAHGLVLIFDRFQLPQGAKFYAYTPGGRRKFGAYTTESCVPSNKFIIGVLPGETSILECLMPKGAALNSLDVHLNRVDYAYDNNALGEFDPAAATDFGNSLPCNINVNCPLGDTWQAEKKGIGRILMVFATGSAWCSGSLIANTFNNADPNFLTAHHCQIILDSPDFDLWKFDFDYEAVGCTNPGTEPIPKSILGCQRLAYRTETDFLLLRLNSLPGNYGLYFNGWTRSTTPSTKSTSIHHPLGDIKKISQDTNAVTNFSQTINWGGIFGISPANTHWKSLTDYGTLQQGSSGSPLLDQNKRIVGQLHGISTNQFNPCIITAAYFGRFDLSWSQGADPASRLKEWLDPGNTNPTTQNGYAQPAPTVYTISGNVKSYQGFNMRNVKVQISGGTSGFTYTDSLGNFSFAGIPKAGNYTITPARDSNDINGVSTFDLVLISKHILGLEALDSPWKLLAADINRSNSITTTDIVDGRKIVLSVLTSFPTNTSWRFFPEFVNFPNPDNPFNPTLPPENISINNLQADYPGVNFIGVKIGDINGNADPGN